MNIEKISFYYPLQPFPEKWTQFRDQTIRKYSIKDETGEVVISPEYDYKNPLFLLR